MEAYRRCIGAADYNRVDKRKRAPDGRLSSTGAIEYSAAANVLNQPTGATVGPEIMEAAV